MDKIEIQMTPHGVACPGILPGKMVTMRMSPRVQSCTESMGVMSSMNVWFLSDFDFATSHNKVIEENFTRKHSLGDSASKWDTKGLEVKD